MQGVLAHRSDDIGAHGLRTIVECEKAKLNPDFYIKTLHSHEYHTAPRADETGDLGRYERVVRYNDSCLP